MRESFFYGREFLNDGDLNAQALSWLSGANHRLHGTTKERPIERFERDERATLKGLAPRPYRSLVRPTPAVPATQKIVLAGLPTVERRPLGVYSDLAETLS